MDENYSMTVSEVADDLGCTKSFVQRLIRQKRLDAVIQTKPIRFYLVDPVSVKIYKTTPKNRGGRPCKEKSQ
jgi:excisionase family DNA binding protein